MIENRTFLPNIFSFCVFFLLSPRALSIHFLNKALVFSLKILSAKMQMKRTSRHSISFSFYLCVSVSLSSPLLPFLPSSLSSNSAGFRFFPPRDVAAAMAEWK